MTLASVLAVSASAIVTAENNPSVYVDDTIINFADQAAVIKDDRTLIPARGVFEAMEAKVNWDEATRTVTITDKYNVIYVTLTIDNPVMKVSTYTSLMNADTKEITLDVAPQILSDRTMIPLRAVSEALNAEVDWDQEAYRVDITTSEKPESDEGLPKLSLEAPEEAVAAGEEFDIYIALENIVPDRFVSSVTAGIEYNKDDFEFVKSALCDAEGTEVENALVETNTDFLENALKTVAVTIDSENASKTDGKVMKLTFKSVTGNSGSFALTKGYYTAVGVGFDTTLLLDDEEAASSTLYNGNSLAIDTTPVTVSPSEASEPTTEPEATAEPEATTAPEATTEPEATTIPAATLSPAETAEPTAAPAE